MKILAISDIHGDLPEIPPADLLLIAGDLSQGFSTTAQQMEFWYESLPAWADSIPVDRIVAVGGNHDFVLEALMNGSLSHMPNIPKLEFLIDSEVTVGDLRIWGAPWNDVVGWAFGKHTLDLAKKFGMIPEGVDIVLVHQPPAGCGAGTVRAAGINEHGTRFWEDKDLGNRALRDQLLQVRPQLVVCGHVHSAHGLHDLDGIPVYNVAATNREYELIRGVRELPELKVNESTTTRID
jgi:Icc-related predicted phosphoesterase